MNPYDPFYNQPRPQNGQPYQSNPYPPNPQGQPYYGNSPSPYPPAPHPYGAIPPTARTLPTQRAALDRPPKRRSLFAAIFPWKGDSFGEVLRKLIFMAALGAFLYYGGIIVNDIVLRSLSNNAAQSEYQDLYDPGTDIAGMEQTDPNSKKPKVRLSSFDELYAKNQDIAGWIKIKNTKVDYPVYQSPLDDPEYYLHRSPKRTDDVYGSIFLDSRVDLETDETRNLILYGHHMADGSMFAQISRYKKLDFYKTTPTFTFNSIYENAEWKVFSVFISNTKEEHGEVFYFIRTKFENDTDYMGFVTQLRVRSLLDIPVDVKADDKIILLSTCSYEFEGFRTVVCARKIRPNESSAVDVSLAKTATNPLYPDIWYRKFGGKKPEIPQYGGSDGDYNKEIAVDPFG